MTRITCDGCDKDITYSQPGSLNTHRIVVDSEGIPHEPGVTALHLTLWPLIPARMHFCSTACLGQSFKETK
jgi:hypothetical protein